MCLYCRACRVLLPYVHILVPQQSGSSGIKQRRDVSFKISKLKQYVKQHVQPPSANSAAPAAYGMAGKPAGAPAKGQSQLLSLPGGPYKPAESAEVAALSAAVVDLGARMDSMHASRGADGSALASVQAAALGDVSCKVEALGAEVAGLRELLLAVLAQGSLPGQQQPQGQ